VKRLIIVAMRASVRYQLLAEFVVVGVPEMHVVVELCMLHEHQLGYVVKFDQLERKFIH
jgi:hypothetical protein